MPDSATTPAEAAAREGAAVPGPAIHLHPTAELAERVLLPGDPGRALALAQALLEKPLMFNHNRGLWGYTGTAPDGLGLTIQSTGIGGPSAAIVLSELIELGARRAIRVGTCGALAPELELGQLVIVREAICADGTSRALQGAASRSEGAPLRVAGDAVLSDGLARAAPSAATGAVLSVDLFYESEGAPRAAEIAADALAVEMEAATLFALGHAERVPVACVLAVTDTFDAQGTRTRIAHERMPEVAERLGTVALAALAS